MLIQDVCLGIGLWHDTKKETKIRIAHVIKIKIGAVVIQLIISDANLWNQNSIQISYRTTVLKKCLGMKYIRTCPKQWYEESIIDFAK